MFPSVSHLYLSFLPQSVRLSRGLWFSFSVSTDFLPMCMCVFLTNVLASLCQYIFPRSLSLSPLSLSLFLIISCPFLAPKDRIFWSPDLSGVRVWPYRMPPLFSFLGDSELGEGNVYGVEAPLPSRLLQVALYPACLSAKGGLGQSTRSAVSLAKPLPAWTPQAFPPLP